MRRAARTRMESALAITLAAGLGLTACTGSHAEPGPDAGSSAAAPRVRTFEFTYGFTVEVPEAAGRVAVWLPYPSDDENQKVEVTRVAAPAPHRVYTEPEFGNRMLHFAVEAPDPGPIAVEMVARVERTEAIRKDLAPANGANVSSRDSRIRRWLAADRLVPLDARVRGLSQQVTGGRETPLDQARAIYDYVVDNMTYNKEGSGWGRGDSYWACDAKRGNCTDFHALFTGLARAAGIPAKFAIGFPIPPERGAGKVAGYHCWSEFYLDGYGWVPVDASEASKRPDLREYFFGAHDEDRVEFTEGRDLVLAPPQRGEPLNYFIYPYVEVDGAPLPDGVRYEFAYRDLGSGAAAGSP